MSAFGALLFFSQKGHHEKEKRMYGVLFMEKAKQERKKERKKLSKFSIGTKAWLYGTRNKP
jgi:hypothetical protein